MSVTHEQQRERWNEEHKTPFALKQMDVQKVSSGVALFLQFLEQQKINGAVGLEMGCGKGRNVIRIAKQSTISKMYGFDFSNVAIAEAKKRAGAEGVADKTQFDVMDATETWGYESDFFDFGIDCTASTDIENAEGRQRAVNEMHRVLKVGGYFLVYVMSTDDEYHKMMIEKSPAREKNAFVHPDTGKFEKVFSEEELDDLYKKFILVEARRIEKTAEFFGKSYYNKHHWRVYKK